MLVQNPYSHHISDPETVARERERDKIRELKRMQIRGGRAGKGGARGLTRLGVFVRHDVEDEAAFEVDIDDSHDGGVPAPPLWGVGGKGVPVVNGKGKSYGGGGKCPELVLDEPMEVKEEQDDPMPLHAGKSIVEHGREGSPPPPPPPSKLRSSRTSSRTKRPKGGKNPSLLVSNEDHTPPMDQDVDVDVDMDDFAFEVAMNGEQHGSLDHANVNGGQQHSSDLDDFEEAVDEAESYHGCSTSNRRSSGRKSASGRAPRAASSTSKSSTKSKTENVKKKGKRGDRGGDHGDEEEEVTLKKQTQKPKPETYKQAWSDEEQRLLEQLLDDIPEGEKFRFVFFGGCICHFLASSLVILLGFHTSLQCFFFQPFLYKCISL
jgi:hypothetical protein